MKRLFSLLVVAVLACACSSIQIAAKSPAQVAADVCPPVQAAIGVLTTPGAVVDPATIDELDKTAQVVNFVCSSGDVVQAPDLKDFADNVIPFLIKNAALFGVAEPQRQEIILALAVAKAAIAQVVK